MSKTINYQLSPFSGLVGSGLSKVALLRDAGTDTQVIPRIDLEAQIHSGDYFVTLATVLDALSRDVPAYQTRATLEDLISDLIYLQDNYTITKNKLSE